MSEFPHRVRGVDHVAYPTFDPAATVRLGRAATLTDVADLIERTS